MTEAATRAPGAASQTQEIGKNGPFPLPETQPAFLPSAFARLLPHIDERRIAALLILVFLVNVWLLNVAVHSDWLPVLAAELRWLLNPQLATPDLPLSLPAVVAVAQILILGTLAVRLVLSGEKDKGIERITALGLGLGLVGWVTMVLSIAGRLERVSVNIAVFSLVCILLYLQFVRDRLIPRQFLSNLRNSFAIWTMSQPRWSLGDLLFAGALAAIAAAEYYQATTTPILHWDALVYHAAMAKLMFQAHGIPVIAGPSVGIEMSSNYPPLYPALGAFFYSQVGAVDDIYLRLISPTAGVLTTLLVYKTACQLGSRRFARIAALFLALAPLFIATSIFAINYLFSVLFMSAVLFFLVRAIVDGASRYWLAAGVAYGLAFSTTYQAYFFLPAVGITLAIAVLAAPRSERAAVVRRMLAMGVATLAIGSVWYLRNLVVVGNPIFPFAQGFFGGKNIDPVMLARSVDGIHTDSLYNFFGRFDFNPLDLPRFLLLNKSHFPVISVITLLGLLLALQQKKRAAWASVLAFGLVPLVVVSSTVANIFPRYFIFSFPGLALVSALPLALALEGLGPEAPISSSRQIAKVRGPVNHARRLPGNARRAITGAFVGFIVLTAIFPASLALFSGQAYQENDWQPPYNPLLLLQHSNRDTFQVLTAYYGIDPSMWQWLDQHLGSAKVATFENKIYYMKDGGGDSIFYLDGWEARDLYTVTDPAVVVQYLSENGIRYILDPSWIRHWSVYNALPLDRYLGMPQYFPIVEGTGGDTTIYQVGRVDNPVTSRSPLALSFQPPDLTASPDMPMAFWKIPGQSTAPRLFVETPPNRNKVSIEIDYQDNGKGTLTVNQRTAIGWDYGEGVAELRGSGQVRTLVFTIPADKERGYAELGLFASSTDVLITGIRAQAAK